MKKRTATLMICVLTMNSCYTIPTFSAEPVIEYTAEQLKQDDSVPYASKYFRNYFATITPKGNGRMNIEVDISGSRDVNMISVKKIILQKQDGIRWINIETFTNKDYPEFDVRDSYLNVIFNIQGIPNEVYRLSVEAYAGNENGGENISFFSVSKTV